MDCESNRYANCVLQSAILWLLLSPALATESVLMRVYLNQQDKGDHFFLMQENIPLFSFDTVESLGLTHIPTIPAYRIDDKTYVSLNDLSPQVTYAIDWARSTIYVDAPPEYLVKEHINLSLMRRPKGMRYFSTTSAFVDYGLNYTRATKAGTNSISVPLAMAVHHDEISAFTSSVFLRDDSSSEYTRLFSTVTHDDLGNLTRLSGGDFIGPATELGGGGIFGGVNLSKNYSIDPYFIRSTGLSVTGLATTPSQVELYLDDRPILRRSVSPGQFEFDDILFASGVQDTRLVITDAFGVRTTIDRDSYLSSRLLREGVEEYNYGMGFRRNNFGSKSFDYGELALAALHRSGLSESLTVGLRSELDADVINIGSEIRTLLGSFGEVGVDFAASQADSNSGVAAVLDYQYVSPFVSGSAQGRLVSDDYSNLSLEPEDPKLRYLWEIDLGVNTGGLGSGTMRYTSSAQHGGDDRRTTGVFYTKQMKRYFTLTARYQHISGSDSDNEVFVSISRSLGSGRFAAAEYSRNDDTERVSTRLSKNLPLGQGFGYRINVGSQEGYTDGGMALEYAGPYGIYSTGYIHTENEDTYLMSTSGAISYADRGVYASRPVTQSFALVSVDNLSGVDVSLNNQYMGKTNKDGRLVIPRLIPYYGNRLSINEQDIPMDYEIQNLEQVAATPFRGGGAVRFAAARLQAFTGTLFILKDGARKPAEYWGLRYRVGEQLTETVVGKGGEFYIENLPSGRTSATIFTPEKECNFVVFIPDSEATLVDLGEVVCEIDN